MAHFKWTYNGSTLNRDIVRDMSGQNSSSDEVLASDGIVDWALGQRNSNVFAASALVCDALAGRYASYPERESVGSLGLTWGDRAEKFKERSKELSRTLLITQGVSPYAGGWSISDKDIDQDDTDREPMSFKIGQDDDPSVGIGSTGTLST